MAVHGHLSGRERVAFQAPHRAERGRASPEIGRRQPARRAAPHVVLAGRNAATFVDDVERGRAVAGAERSGLAPKPSTFSVTVAPLVVCGTKAIILPLMLASELKPWLDVTV